MSDTPAPLSSAQVEQMFSQFQRAAATRPLLAAKKAELEAGMQKYDDEFKSILSQLGYDPNTHGPDPVAFLESHKASVEAWLTETSALLGMQQ